MKKYKELMFENYLCNFIVLVLIEFDFFIIVKNLLDRR